MIEQNDPTKSKTWPLLVTQARLARDFSIARAFRADTERFGRFSFSLGAELLVDFSKNIWDEAIFALLIAFAEDLRITERKQALFGSGACLHPLFRAPTLAPRALGTEITVALDRMQVLTDRLHNRTLLGYAGAPIRHIVHLGIGGSCLATRMALEALVAYRKSIRVRYVASIDAQGCRNVMDTLSPETTLFIISSKSFATTETLTNATALRDWFCAQAPKGALSQHFFAVTAAVSSALRFGIPQTNIFSLPHELCGRFSWSSAAGLPIACGLGYEAFSQMLSGARAADEHLMQAPLHQNIPVLMALLDVWYITFLGYPTQAAICYADGLRLFPSYWQQLAMESNAKFLDCYGKKIAYTTAVPLWGGAGCEGQHSFFQWFYQSRQLVFSDFIACANVPTDLPSHERQLLSHGLAQTQSLMQPPGKNTVGNRPSTFLLLKEPSPYSLGLLMALYEHRVFVEGLLWNIPTYEQEGVDHGKQLRHQDIMDDLGRGGPPARTAASHDASTRGLMGAYRHYKKQA